MLLPFTQSPFLKLVISSFLHSSHVISLSFLSYFWKVRGIGPLVLRTNISPTGFGNSMILKLPSSQLERQLSIQHEHRSWSTSTCTSLHLSFVYRTHHFSLWPTRSILSFLLLLLLATQLSLQSCLTLCDPMDCSPPGSAVPGILQARTLEWVAISFSSAWKWKVKGKLLSRVWLLATPWTAAYQAPPSMGFSGQEYWSGCHCLLPLSFLGGHIRSLSIFAGVPESKSWERIVF